MGVVKLVGAVCVLLSGERWKWPGLLGQLGSTAGCEAVVHHLKQCTEVHRV